MRKFIIAAALAGTILPLQASAQQGGAATPNTPPAQPTPEQQADFRRGVAIFRAFTAAVESEQVQAPVKTRLISCLYTNKLGDISRATGQVLANSPNLKADNPGDIYRAAAGVCGIVFKKTAEAPK